MTSKNSAAAVFKVLIIDDNLDIRYLIEAALSADPRLEMCGQTATAVEALALAREMLPALVILNHQIDGEIMGLSAAPMIKSAAPGARIILFSSEDLSDQVGRDPAIDVYLPKTDLRKLLSTAQELLGLDPAV